MKRWLAIVALLFGSVAFAETTVSGTPGCNQLPNLACADGTDASQVIDTSWVMNTGKTLQASNLGVEFTESDTNPTCSSGNFSVYADLSENKLKKCQNGVATDLDTGGSNPAWSDITAPSGNLSLSMAANTTTFTWGATTGAGANMFVVKDTTSNTGTGVVFWAQTASSSAAKPFAATAGGTANGVEMTTAGRLQKIGTGNIEASDVVCTTCVGTTDVADNAIDGAKIAISSNATGDLMYYNGTDWVRLAAGTSSQVLVGGSTPAFAGISSSLIGAGDLANVLVWNETPTGSWPNLTLANSPRAADTALVVNNGIVLTRKTSACSGEANQYTLSGTTLTMCDAGGGGTVRAVYEM